MPILEFVCTSCGTFSDRIIPYSQRDQQKCFNCDCDLELLDSVPARRTTGFAGKAGGLPVNWGSHDPD